MQADDLLSDVLGSGEGCMLKIAGKRDSNHVACLFQYSLNEKKMLELRTEIVSLVRTEADVSVILFVIAFPLAQLRS